jgi:hypothetical protein
MAGGRRMGTPTGSHISDYPVVGGAGGKAGGFSDTGSRLHGSPGPKGTPPIPAHHPFPKIEYSLPSLQRGAWLHNIVSLEQADLI